MSHHHPAPVLLHTVGYLLLHRAPSYYPLITYRAGTRGKWVTASISPPAIHFSQSGSDQGSAYNTSRELLKLISEPPGLCRCPSEQTQSILLNTQILLRRLPGTFHAIINPDFCPTHRAGGSSNVPVCSSIWKRGITRSGKIGLFSLAPVMLEGGGQLCRRASRLQGGRWDSTQLSASSPSFMDLSARTVTGLGAKPRGVGPTTGSHWVPVM